MAHYIFIAFLESLVRRIQRLSSRLNEWRASKGMVITCEVCRKKSAVRGESLIFEADWKDPEESDLEYVILPGRWSGLVRMWAIDQYAWVWFCSSKCEDHWLAEPKTIHHVPD